MLRLEYIKKHKEKDSYRRLQDAFYEYMSENNFELQRGQPKEEIKLILKENLKKCPYWQ